MSKITKVNANEGRHIVGYKCDSCGVKSYLPDRPNSWIESDGNDYCNDCTYICQKCNKIEFEKNIGNNDFCNSCNEKLMSSLDNSFNLSKGILDILEEFVKSASIDAKELELLYKAGENCLQKLKDRREEIYKQLKPIKTDLNG